MLALILSRSSVQWLLCSRFIVTWFETIWFW